MFQDNKLSAWATTCYMQLIKLINSVIPSNVWVFKPIVRCNGGEKKATKYTNYLQSRLNQYSFIRYKSTINDAWHSWVTALSIVILTYKLSSRWKQRQHKPLNLTCKYVIICSKLWHFFRSHVLFLLNVFFMNLIRFRCTLSLHNLTNHTMGTCFLQTI